MYKKITIEYLIRLIRALKQDEQLEFSTAAYDGGLNFSVLHLTILDENHIAVVAPSICEKAFLIYMPDLNGTFWEKDFKFFLETLDAEVGLDPDGYPYIKSDEIERYLNLHPELKPDKGDVWDAEEKNVPKCGIILDKYYQPIDLRTSDFPIELASFCVFPSVNDCKEWLKDMDEDIDCYTFQEMTPGTIQGPTLLYKDGENWCGTRLIAIKMTVNDKHVTMLYPDDNDEIETMESNVLQEAVEELSKYDGFIDSTNPHYVHENDLTEDDLKNIDRYFIFYYMTSLE